MADRAQRIPVEQFVSAYVETHKADETYGDLADRLGCKTSTAYQRSYELRKKGVALPRLRSSRHGTAIAERARKALDSLMLKAGRDSHEPGLEVAEHEHEVLDAIFS